MNDVYVVRDKHTLKALATYTSRAALYADWFEREGNLWVPKAEIVAVTQGSMTDELYEYMAGQDTEPGT